MYNRQPVIRVWWFYCIFTGRRGRRRRGGGDGTLSKTPDSGIGATVSKWFTPVEGGASLGGNVLSGVGTAVGIGSGLASMYYANEERKLKKEKAQMEKDAYQRGVQREAEAENRMQQFAKNAGNGAFYK